MDVGDRAISLRVRAMDLFSRTFSFWKRSVSFRKRSVVLLLSEKHLRNGLQGVLMTSMDTFRSDDLTHEEGHGPLPQDFSLVEEASALPREQKSLLPEPSRLSQMPMAFIRKDFHFPRMVRGVASGGS
jgi:hypothetical protein